MRRISWSVAPTSRDLPRRTLVNPAAAVFAVLAGLPDAAGADVEACQPAAAVGASVEADRVFQHERPAAALFGVAANHGLAGLVRLRPFIHVFPVQHRRWLSVQRQIRVDSGVDKEVRPLFEPVDALRFEELPVPLGNVLNSPALA